MFIFQLSLLDHLSTPLGEEGEETFYTTYDEVSDSFDAMELSEIPLYFKKAIDEAESEWSQHNAKKLIDTSVKGLGNSIPKNFPSFHVEFGLDKGFSHVIDDEQQFNTNLGLNVIRGMLELPDEDMYRRRRMHESWESQKEGSCELCTRMGTL
ncbi:unnamed protein product [Eruca vesicaria subsp. sativa]|uniref:Cwf19-like protein C-terminal domain-containing protein n=1 Tax=Eruca vesicaria subsp. sativa TaxID=29727 RepID=A0ABC8KAS7_ERUVS|nr:unnamed protein product [Eruca vesicaria subsp. sativa]